MFNISFWTYKRVLSNTGERNFAASVDFSPKYTTLSLRAERTIKTELKAAEMAKSQWRINHF